MAVKKDKKVLGIVISISDFKRLEALAKSQDRSVSNYSLRLILKALEQEEKKKD